LPRGKETRKAVKNKEVNQGKEKCGRRHKGKQQTKQQGKRKRRVDNPIRINLQPLLLETRNQGGPDERRKLLRKRR